MWNLMGLEDESPDMQQLREAFQNYDADGSGFIDRDELISLLRDLGHNYTEDELARMMALLSEDEATDGLDFDSFISLVMRQEHWNKMQIKGSSNLHF
mmetsp:Transcript_45160/g.120082  ORF Transcript_45160/g.120082 Transcript_45160/m.120082 type:complete len:98 (+) Transcript_45160:380-673(+)